MSYLGSASRHGLPTLDDVYQMWYSSVNFQTYLTHPLINYNPKQLGASGETLNLQDVYQAWYAQVGFTTYLTRPLKVCDYAIFIEGNSSNDYTMDVLFSTINDPVDSWNITMFQAKVTSSTGAQLLSSVVGDTVSLLNETDNISFVITQGVWGIVGSADFSSLNAELTGTDLKAVLPLLEHSSNITPPSTEGESINNHTRTLCSLSFDSVPGVITLDEIKVVAMRDGEFVDQPILKGPRKVNSHTGIEKFNTDPI